MSYQSILDFWFGELSPKQWWVKEEKLDKLIKDRFHEIHRQATQGELFNWRKNIEGRLAEIILIDQFSRNIYRNDPKSFAWDGIALVLAQEAINLNLAKNLEPQKRAFLYLPYMHSESKIIHEEAIKLYSEEGLEFNLEFEYKHKRIIDRFGRYPHRNQVLGRTSTKEEIEFLKEKDSSF